MLLTYSIFMMKLYNSLKSNILNVIYSFYVTIIHLSFNHISRFGYFKTYVPILTSQLKFNHNRLNQIAYFYYLTRL